MALLPFCNNEEVRAILGVNDLELKDETLDLPIYSLGLEHSLRKLAPVLSSTFLAIHELPTDTRTQKQNDLYTATRLYSAYSVARQAGIALSMYGPKTISDEKASFSRFPGEPYKEVLEMIEEELAKYGKLALEALAELKEIQLSSYTPISMVAVRRVYDPVTGEGSTP